MELTMSTKEQNLLNFLDYVWLNFNFLKNSYLKENVFSMSECVRILNPSSDLIEIAKVVEQKFVKNYLSKQEFTNDVMSDRVVVDFMYKE
jgi:hypothetical protein